MNKLSSLKHFFLDPGKRTLFLSISWVSGLFCGILLSASAPKVCAAVFKESLKVNTAPFHHVAIQVLPILLIAVALKYLTLPSCSALIFILALCRGLCAMTIFFAVGSGAWLVRLLYLFSGCCTSVLIWLLLIRHSREVQPHFFREVCLSVLIICFLSAMDYAVISPAVSQLSKYF